MKRLVHRVAQTFGIDIVRYRPPGRQPVVIPPDVSEQERATLLRVDTCTMTSVESQLALVQAVRYLLREEINGCFVECGVWRGGSSMAVALTLLQEGRNDRHVYLYDTFEGMTLPTKHDRSPEGTLAETQLARDPDVRCIASLDEASANMASTGYPADHLHFIKGPVETTLPASAPTEPIALLRLDTDWYESTRHELVHLFPRLQEGGILIIDDYGHWSGSRKAVDEYLATLSRRFYMHRIDYAARLLVKR